MKKQIHLPALDGLRGLAVILVFVYHYGGGTHSSIRAMQIFGFLNKGGWAGVTLFFTLSGFLITGILWDSYDDPHWWRNFYMRRTLRIFPLYFGTILLVLLGALAVGTLSPALRMIWVPLLFLQNIPGLMGNIDHLPSPLPLFHFWSLAVEEQFYLVWPFLLVLQKTRSHARTLCAATFVAACLFRILIWHLVAYPDPYIESLPARAGELAAGGWLALSYRGPEWRRVQQIAPVAGFVGLCGFLAAGLLNRSFEPGSRWMADLGLPSVTLFFGALLVSALRPGRIASLLSAAWLRWIGGISFGIYVFHVLLGGLFHTLTHALAGSRSSIVQNAVSFILAAIGSIAAAWLSFHLYEVQFLRLKRRFSPGPTA